MVDKPAAVNDYTFMTDDNIIPHELWTVRLNFPQRLTGDLPVKISDAVEDLGVSVLLHNREAADGDNWTVTLTTRGAPDIDGICARIKSFAEDEGVDITLSKKDVFAERLPETDWLQHVHENFPPIVSGRFFIYGSHYEGEHPPGLIPLKIDAATAFGSGEHETTRGCLLLLERLKDEGRVFRNGLDMGCGSGILAIAMQKLWPAIKVTAIDIDPESVTVTGRHAEMNNVTCATEAGDGYNAPLAGKNAPYDVVAANILANPLIEMAPALFNALQPGGYALLSGLLHRQRDEVIAAHEKRGLKLLHVEEIGTAETGLWQALLFQK